MRSTPNYAELGGVHTIESDGTRVFAGQRDDPFFVDLGGTFDLLGIRGLDGNSSSRADSLKGFNVHSIALEIPIERLSRSGTEPSSPNDPAAIIGVWATASRPSMTTRTAGSESHSGSWVQVSRLGQPLVNEVVIPRALKDAFNGLEPTGDAAALPVVLDPEVPKLLEALFGILSPPAPRNDLVTIFLTGIPGLNQPQNVTPSEMLRLNMAIPPTSRPSVLGVLSGDLAGLPQRPPVDRRRRRHRAPGDGRRDAADAGLQRRPQRAARRRRGAQRSAAPRSVPLCGRALLGQRAVRP